MHLTSVTPECIFSVLKWLNTYLKPTMTEERLSGSTLTSIDKDDLNHVDVEKDILLTFMKQFFRIRDISRF